MTIPESRKPPFYTDLSFQVLVAIAAAIVFGYFSPNKAIAFKPLGDAFIRLITMIITLIIFCTVVTGIAGMESMKKVGRVGGKALLYFEAVSTLALMIGLIIGNIVHPGNGWNIDASTLDPKAVADYAGQAKAQSVSDFILHIIPNTVTDAFAKGDILQVLFISVLFGLAISAAGPRCKPLLDFLNGLTQAVFGVVKIVMRFAPIGAFGAMAFTVGKYGIAALGPLVQLIGVFYLTCVLFVTVVLGVIARLAGFNIFKFLRYIKEEIHDRPGRSVVGSGAANPDGKNGEAGLLKRARRIGAPHGLHVQHRRHQPLHDASRAFRGTSDQHASDSHAAINHLCRRHVDLQRRQRRVWRCIYRTGRHVNGDPDNSSCGNGTASWH